MVMFENRSLKIPINNTGRYCTEVFNCCVRQVWELSVEKYDLVSYGHHLSLGKGFKGRKNKAADFL